MPSDQEFGAPDTLDGFAHGYAVANGVRLHYEIGGEGEPLVLLEGFPRTTHALHGIMTELAKRFRVIAVDYRGQGGSEKPADGYDKEDHGERRVRPRQEPGLRQGQHRRR